jgi:hypothetical protein
MFTALVGVDTLLKSDIGRLVAADVATRLLRVHRIFTLLQQSVVTTPVTYANIRDNEYQTPLLRTN